MNFKLTLICFVAVLCLCKPTFGAAIDSDDYALTSSDQSYYERFREYFISRFGRNTDAQLQELLSEYPKSVRDNFKTLPNEIQSKILGRSNSFPGCWLPFETKTPFMPNTCANSKYPELSMNGFCYEKCREGSFGVGGRCWSGIFSISSRDGIPATCPNQKALWYKEFCFDDCERNYNQHGPLCVYSTCPSIQNPFSCGLGCTPDIIVCGRVVMDYARKGIDSLVHIVQMNWAGLSIDVQNIIANIMAWKLCPIN